MQQVSAEEIYKRLSKPITMLDVRTPEEFNKGHIHASISLPLETLENDVEKYAPDKSQEIYIYCFSGSRSTLAGMILEQLGYKRVLELSHGLLSWRAKGYMLEQ